MMKRFLRNSLTLLLVIAVLFSMAACSGSAVVKPYRYNPSLKRNNIASTTAAQNEKYELRWDSDACLAVLVDKTNGKTYSSVPEVSTEEEAFGGDSDALLKMLSPITVDCVRSETYELKTGYGADCMEKGDFSVSLINNGIRVTYIFDEFKLSVPVHYTLFEDGLRVELDPAKIAEDGEEYFLHTVALSPFMCRAENKSKNSYLFYPSGSGALIGMTEENSVSTNYTSEVYGRDRMSDIPTWCVETNTEEIRMPVFGAKRKEDALFAVIDSGAEAAWLTLDAFNESMGYSAVYPEFAVRGESSVSNRFLSSSVNSVKYADYFTLQKMSVLYYPIEGGDASYNDMAEIYRRYLTGKGLEKKENSNTLSVKILGGAMINDSVLGIPTRKLFATATLKDAEAIVNDLSDKIGEKLNVDLVGYGKTGLEIGQVCGGFTVPGSLGGKKGLKDFYQKASAAGNRVYFDMDLTEFAKSGSGYSVSNAAVTVTRQRGQENSYLIATKNRKKLLCYFIPRKLVSKVAEKSLSLLDRLGVKGVALDAFSNSAYSDYADQQYYSKGNTSRDVSATIRQYRKNGVSVMTHAANIYAATVSDLILDVPLQSSKMDFFSEEIPFYEMVLQGFIPMVSPSLNLAGNREETLLKAAEAGTGLSYTLIRHYNGKLREEFDIYQNACYDDIKSDLLGDYERYKDLYSAVDGAAVVRHTILKKGIRKTEFENGVSVYTNFGDREYRTPFGTLQPYSFLFGRESAQKEATP